MPIYILYILYYNKNIHYVSVYNNYTGGNSNEF